MNKEIHNLLKKDLVFHKSVHKIKPYILKLHATYLVRKKFVHRLQSDLEYRTRYLYIHNTESPHFCWQKRPPSFLVVNSNLENIVRLLRKDAIRLDNILNKFLPRHYNFLLKHVILKDGKLCIQ